jgi:hypothetical protein
MINLLIPVVPAVKFAGVLERVLSSTYLAPYCVERISCCNMFG